MNAVRFFWHHWASWWLQIFSKKQQFSWSPPSGSSQQVFLPTKVLTGLVKESLMCNVQQIVTKAIFLNLCGIITELMLPKSLQLYLRKLRTIFIKTPLNTLTSPSLQWTTDQEDKSPKSPQGPVSLHLFFTRQVSRLSGVRDMLCCLSFMCYIVLKTKLLLNQTNT